MEETTNGIPDRIKQAVKKSGKTQRDLARKIGIGESAFSSYVNGGAQPSADGFRVIAEECDVSIDWLITGVKPLGELTQSAGRTNRCDEPSYTAIPGTETLVREGLSKYGDDSPLTAQEAVFVRLLRSATQQGRDAAMLALSSDVAKRVIDSQQVNGEE